MAELNAALEHYEPADSFDTLPPGEYPAQIIDSAVDYSKSGNLIAKFTWQITDGQFMNRQIWDQMVIQGSDKAVEIGMRRIKAMAVVCELPNPNYIRDTEEFHGRQAIIKLKIEHDEKYGDKNRIQAFKSIRPAAQGQPAGTAQVSPMTHAQPSPARQAPAAQQGPGPRPQQAPPPNRPPASPPPPAAKPAAAALPPPKQGQPWNKPGEVSADGDLPF